MEKPSGPRFLSVQAVDAWARENGGEEAVRNLLVHADQAFLWYDRGGPKLLREWLQLNASRRMAESEKLALELEERGAAASERAAVAAERSAVASDRAAVASEAAAQAAKVSARWTFWAAIASAIGAVASMVATMLQAYGSK